MAKEESVLAPRNPNDSMVVWPNKRSLRSLDATWECRPQEEQLYAVKQKDDCKRGHEQSKVG